MELALIISAIGLRFASGFHCIGMCGPIALSMGLTKNQKANFYLQNITYQFGRIFTSNKLAKWAEALIYEGQTKEGNSGKARSAS
ncbi:MAG: sulfite exporter TauE/SafE family protein, partial [Chitinophagaceae bacterium]